VVPCRSCVPPSLPCFLLASLPNSKTIAAYLEKVTAAESGSHANSSKTQHFLLSRVSLGEAVGNQINGRPRAGAQHYLARVARDLPTMACKR
jgi:hypothetical protein